MTRDESEQQLLEHQPLLTFLAMTDLPLAVLDDDRLVTVNPPMAALFGRSAEELSGRNWLELSAPTADEEPPLEEDWSVRRRAALDGVSQHFEWRMLGADDRVWFAEVILTRLGFQDGTRLVVTARDITERVEQRHRKDLLQTVLERTNQAVLVLDRDGRGLYANPEYLETHDVTLERVLGSHPQTWLADDEYARIDAEEMVRTLDRIGFWRGQVPMGSGRTREWRDIRLFSIDERSGARRALVSLVDDITEQKNAERALRASESRYRAVFEHAAIGILTLDGSGAIRDANPALLQMLGHSTQTVHGRQLVELAHPGDLHRLRSAIEFESEVQEPRSATLRLLRADGAPTWVSLTFGRLDASRGPRGDRLILAQDVNAQRRAELQIQAYQADLRAMSSALQLAEERERRRIAANLHDGAAQNIAAARMRLRRLQRHTTIEAAPEFDEIELLLDVVADGLRSLSRELSPPILFELGLAPAIEAYIQRFSADRHIACRLVDDGQCAPLGTDERTLLYRSACELMANAATHGGPSEILVELSCDGDAVVLSVQDDGRGFPQQPPEPGQSATGGGFGLFNIKERIRGMGGRLTVGTSRSGGAAVTVELPTSAPTSA